MTISFNNSPLDVSVVTTALNTQSADQAYKQMGFLEKIIDYFRGNIKYKEIDFLIRKVANTDSVAIQGKTADTESLVQFQKLSSLAKDEHQDKFSIDFMVDEENGTWGYALKIEQTVIRRANDLPIAGNMDFFAYEAAYQDQEVVNYIADVLQQEGERDVPGKMARLRESLAQINNEYVNLHSGFNISDTNRAEKIKAMTHYLPDGIQSLHPILDINEQNSYQFTIGEKIFYAAESISVEDESALLSLWAAKIEVDMKNDLYEFGSEHTRENMLDVIQEMADLPAEQEAIRQILYEPGYSSDNFRGVTFIENGERMIAEFENNKTVVFAGPNRVSTNKEWRGEVLKTRLQMTSYANLHEFITSAYMTEDDNYFVSILTHSVQENLSQAPPEIVESLKQQIATLEVGNTSLSTVFNIPIEIPNFMISEYI
jgi:hypothetical protein